MIENEKEIECEIPARSNPLKQLRRRTNEKSLKKHKFLQIFTKILYLALSNHVQTLLGVIQITFKESKSKTHKHDKHYI